MVYGTLMKHSETHGVYNVGNSTDNLTAEIVFFADGRRPAIRKQAEGCPVPQAHIIRLYLKYGQTFARGEFREKISIEIG